MESTSFSSFVEGQSTVRPPLFDGLNYIYWRYRMSIYLQSIDFEIWEIASSPYELPIGSSNELDERAKRRRTLNSKAMNAILCSLNKTEFFRVQGCTTAYEMWHLLEVTHVGTAQVKGSKIRFFNSQYELFKMLPNETINAMFTRFTEIVNNLKNLGKVYSESEQVHKIIASLTEEWDKKTTAIEEAKDLDKMSLEDLMGNLMNYEFQQNNRKTIKTPKSIALHTNDNADSEDSEEDLALLTHKFKKFWKKKQGKKGESSQQDRTCFKCKKAGHLIKDCPLNKQEKEPKKWGDNQIRKALQATWDECSSSDEESGDEESANMCFMASLDEVTSSVKINEQKLLNKIRMLEKMIETFDYECEKLMNECTSQTDELEDIKGYVSDLEKENKNHVDKIAVLEKQNDDLKSIVYKFTKGSENLDKLLGSQRMAYNKSGLGYDPYAIYSSYNNMCSIKKDTYTIKKIWIPKCKVSDYKIIYPLHNKYGPKKAWVPKLSLIA